MHPVISRFVCAVALVASALGIDVASVQAATDAQAPVAAPELRVGDRWVYHVIDGYRQKIEWDETHEIVAIDANAITVAVKAKGGGKETSRTEIWSAPGVVRSGAIFESETDRFDPPLIRYPFPMVVGSKWSQRVRNLDKPPGPYGPISYQAAVRGRESVTTPAGTFDALRVRYVMRLDDESLSQKATECDYLVWYAPSVGAMVREQKRSHSVQKSSRSP
ncbi:MAG: TapB family protein, partial [Casimicrobiaceae bacterium]